MGGEHGHLEKLVSSRSRSVRKDCAPPRLLYLNDAKCGRLVTCGKICGVQAGDRFAAIGKKPGVTGRRRPNPSIFFSSSATRT